MLDFNEKKISTPKKSEVEEHLRQVALVSSHSEKKQMTEKSRSIKKEVIESKSREKPRSRGRPKKQKVETKIDLVEDLEPKPVGDSKKGRKKVKKD